MANEAIKAFEQDHIKPNVIQRKRKIYDPNLDVLQAARQRISWLFDEFEHIRVSISSGKDSTVLYHLALQEAIKRDRKIKVFFLDQEAEYEDSIRLVKEQMTHPNVEPYWYQVPILLTNSTSYSDYFLDAWGKGETWMRKKDPMAIQEIDEEYPNRFYTFFPWMEQKDKHNTANLVGLRADESITRYRAVTKHTGYKETPWASSDDDIHKFYPIYDFAVYDIWKFIYDYRISYNKMYDLMYMDGKSIYSDMRVSNLIHEKSYKCLIDLPRYEPETFDLLCKRIGGISTAQRYASEKLVFSNKQLPSHYENWKEFRDFLLMSIPVQEHKDKFQKRFEKQQDDERTYKAQVGQLLINDYENSCSFDTKKDEKTKQIREKWTNIL